MAIKRKPAPRKRKKLSSRKKPAAFSVKPKSRKGGYQKLRNLGCFEEMKARMLRGWPLKQLARFIQDDNGELEDMPIGALCGTLANFRKTLPPGEFANPPGECPTVVKERMTPHHERAIERMKESLDEVEELEKLFRLQMERVKIDNTHEKDNEKLLPSMTQEIRLAKEILESSAQLKMDLGIEKRHLGSIEASTRIVDEIGSKYGTDAVAKVLEDPKSVHRVRALANKFLLTSGSGENVEELLRASERAQNGNGKASNDMHFTRTVAEPTSEDEP
jgi:hypothetical protein